MSEHTAEPWICRIDETVTIRDSQDNQLGILTHLHTRTGGRRDADEVAANARRIVACVNACKDVDNETLEKIASGDMDGSEIVELAKVKKQHAALLALIRECRGTLRTDQHDGHRRLARKIDATIAESIA